MTNKALQKDIPKGWKLLDLDLVSHIVMGQSPRSSSYNQIGEGLPFFQGKADFTDSYRTIVRQWTSEPTKLSEPGDLLLSVRAPVGDVAINDRKACIGRGLAAIRAKNEISVQEFIFYTVQSLKTFLNTKAQGSTFTAINGPALRRIPILLPSTSEQKKIAEILGTVDDEIQKTDQIIAQTEKLKNGLMQELFRGIGHEKFKKIQLGDIASVLGGKRLPVETDFSVDKTSHPYIRVVDFQDLSIKKNGLKYIDDQTYQIIKKYIINKEDIFISIAGTIGRVGVVPSELDRANLTENAARIVLNQKDDYLRDYILYFLASGIGQKQIKSLTVKTTQPKLALNKIEQLILYIPDNREYLMTIINTLKEIQNRITCDRLYRKKLFQLKKGLMQDLLSGKVRV